MVASQYHLLPFIIYIYDNVFDCNLASNILGRNSFFSQSFLMGCIRHSCLLVNPSYDLSCSCDPERSTELGDAVLTRMK